MILAWTLQFHFIYHLDFIFFMPKFFGFVLILIEPLTLFPLAVKCYNKIMPLYEYFCSDCQSTFDLLRHITEADKPIVCPDCNGRHTSRGLSTFYCHSSNAGDREAVPTNSTGNGASGACCGGLCGCG